MIQDYKNSLEYLKKNRIINLKFLKEVYYTTFEMLIWHNNS